MMNQEENKIDIVAQLNVFWRVIRKFWIQMAVVILISTVANFFYTYVNYVPMYQSYATFTVNADGRGDSGSKSSEQIKESLPYILNSTHMRNLVMQDLGINSFPASLSLSSGETATFYEVRVTAQNAEMSYQIMNSVLENCPKASIHVLGNVTTTILDRSEIPTTPSNVFDKRTSVIKGAIIGAIICAIFISFYAFTNKTIQTEEDLKKYLSVSCLAIIPQVVFKKRAKEVKKNVHIHNDRVGYAFLENIRMMRARIQRSMEQTDAKVLMMTSSLPQEGKSTIAANLALALAEVGNKVILIDLDLRNPSVENVLGIKKGKKEGITEILADTARLEQQVSYIRQWNLSILRAGEPKNNPLELLGKEKLGSVIRSLRKKYDYVILDTPPSAILSDASVIAKYADCSVYVVKQDYARIERITEGLDQLSIAQVPIIGVVLNGAEKGSNHYSSYRYGAYGARINGMTEVVEEPEYIDLENPWEK